MINRHLLATAALATALCGAGAAAAQAQSATSATPAPAASAAPFHHQHRHSRLMRALRSVDLSSAQRTQIKAILGDARRAKQSGTPETRRQVIGQIEGVLTPGQRAQFEAALAHRAAAQPQAQPQPAATN